MRGSKENNDTLSLWRRVARLSATDLGGAALIAILHALNRIGGTLLVLAGLLLAEIPWIAVNQPEHSDGFRLIQFHIVLTGALSIIAASTARRDAIISSPSLLMLGVNGWLGFLALASNDAQLYWPAALFVVSAVNFGYLLATDVKAEPEEAAAENAGDADDGLIPANFGVARDGGRLRGGLQSLGAIGLTVGLTFALLFFGGIYVLLLKAAIFDGDAISFARVMENLAHGAGGEAMAKAVITVVVLVIVYGGIFIIEAIVAALLKNKAAGSALDPDRDLTRAERAFAQDALGSLATYLDARRYKSSWRALYVVGVVGVIASFLAVPAAMMWAETVIFAALEPARAAGADPIFYSEPFWLGSMVGGFFAGALLFWSLYQVLGARHPEFGEYLFAKAGWNSMNNRPREPIELLQALVRHIRAKRIDIDDKFDPAAFLYSAFREPASIIYKATILSVVAAAALMAADVARYQLVDDESVAYSEYFRFASKRVEFADLDRVELRCMLFEPDDDGNVNLGVDYLLVEDGAFRIDLFVGSEEEPERLERLEALDAKLVSQGVEFARAESAGFLQGGKSSFISSCAQEIEARYSPQIAPRLIRLIRADRFADLKAPGDAELAPQN
jgi:hypothetical protein